MKNQVFLFFIMCLCIISCSYINTIDSINISEYLPEKLEFCGIEIDSSFKEYEELYTWFNNNQKNWQFSPASYIIGTEFRSNLIHINILDNFVIVNYKDKDGKWKQTSHKKELTELNYICDK
jgi:hypothetical protein